MDMHGTDNAIINSREASVHVVKAVHFIATAYCLLEQKPTKGNQQLDVNRHAFHGVN